MHAPMLRCHPFLSSPFFLSFFLSSVGLREGQSAVGNKNSWCNFEEIWGSWALGDRQDFRSRAQMSIAAPYPLFTFWNLIGEPVPSLLGSRPFSTLVLLARHPNCVYNGEMYLRKLNAITMHHNYNWDQSRLGTFQSSLSRKLQGKNMRLVIYQLFKDLQDSPDYSIHFTFV